MKGILGRKIGMTQVFTKEGRQIPVTIIEVQPNVVMQVKQKEKDGYNAIQLGVFEKKIKNANKPEMGISKKAKTTPKRFLKEIRDIDGNYNLGDKLEVDLFAVGEIVDVTGTSKGKGFAGSIKRHNQSRGPMSHGSHYHRGPGSLGTMLAKRVLKGKKLPGHMGSETITIQNLEIIDINKDENYLLVSGSIPGAKRSFVIVRSAIKNKPAKNPQELIYYEKNDQKDIAEEKDGQVEPLAKEKIEIDKPQEEQKVKEENIKTEENTIVKNTDAETKDETAPISKEGAN